MTTLATRALTTVLLAIAVPASGAVHQRDGAANDAGWFDRYVQGRRGAEQTERVSETYRVGPGGALDLQNIAGDVRVTGGTGQDIRVEAIKRVRDRDADDARQTLADLRVEITRVGDRVEVRTQYPRSRGRVSAQVDYTITVPAGVSVAVKTVSGDLRLERIDGEVRAESVSGDVDVTAAPRLETAKSVSGDVTIRDIRAASTLSLGSVSGSVTARNVVARSLEISAVSGDIDLAGLEVERLEAKSVSGGVEYTGVLASGGRYEISSHSGDVRVYLSGDTGFELDASTFSGSIRSDLPVTTRPDRGGSRGRSARSIRGSYGDASAILSLRTFSGSVVVSRR